MYNVPDPSTLGPLFQPVLATHHTEVVTRQDNELSWRIFVFHLGYLLSYYICLVQLVLSSRDWQIFGSCLVSSCCTCEESFATLCLHGRCFYSSSIATFASSTFTAAGIMSSDILCGPATKQESDALAKLFVFEHVYEGVDTQIGRDQDGRDHFKGLTGNDTLIAHVEQEVVDLVWCPAAYKTQGHNQEGLDQVALYMGYICLAAAPISGFRRFLMAGTYLVAQGQDNARVHANHQRCWDKEREHTGEHAVEFPPAGRRPIGDAQSLISEGARRGRRRGLHIPGPSSR